MDRLIIYTLIPYAFIGLMFISLLTTGLIINGKQCAIALDQFIGTCVIAGHMADETISAWAHRKQHKRTECLINWLFRDDMHCAQAYVAEMASTQNAKEYRK